MDKFDRLFDAGRRALLAGEVSGQTPPVDGGQRWGMSVLLRPDQRAAQVLAGLTAEAMELAGRRHWPTGAPESSHFTVRALDVHRMNVPEGDEMVGRCVSALRRAATGTEPLELRLCGLTVTPSSVMACAADSTGAVDGFAARLVAELGPDGHYEAAFVRDIWYACLIHFAGPVGRPKELLDWVDGRRRTDLGTSTSGAAQLILWRFNGIGMVPRVLAEVPFAA